MQTKQYQIIFKADQDFPLRVRFETQKFTNPHTHQFTEIVIILSGSGIHETKFSKDEIKGGDVLVIPRGGYHGYPETNNLELVNLLFDPEKLPIPLIDLYKLPGFNALFSIKNDYFDRNRFYPRFYVSGENFKKIKWILSGMRGEYENMVPGYRCCLMGYFMILLGELSRLYTENLSEVNEPAFSIGQAISFINLNFQRNIKVEELLKNTGMSRSTFTRKFHQAVGLSPIHYLLQIRISEACKLLLQSKMNVSEIAYQVGFTDSNYFSRLFREITGVTPREYRKKENPESN